MPALGDDIVSVINITAVDDASAVMARVAESGSRAASDFEAANAKIAGSAQAMSAKLEALSVKIDSVAIAAGKASGSLEALGVKASGAGDALGSAGAKGELAGKGMRSAGAGAIIGGSGMSKAGTEATLAGDKMSKSGDKAVVSAAKWKSAGRELRHVAIGIGGISIAAAGLSIDSAVKFDEVLQKIQGNTFMTNKQMAQVRAETLKLGAAGPAGLNDIAAGFEHAANMGYYGAKAMKLVTESWKVAVATGGSVSDTVNLISKSLKNFHVPLSDIGNFTAELMKGAAVGDVHLPDFIANFSKIGIAASSMHQPIAQAIALYAGMTRATKDAAQAQTLTFGMLSHMVAPTGPALKIMKELQKTTGIDLVTAFSEASKGTIPLTQALDDARRATHGNVGEIYQLFGGLRGGLGALHTFSSGWKDYLQIQKQVAGAKSPIVDKEFHNMMKTSAAQLKEFKNQVQELAISLGTILLPALMSIVKAIEPMVKSFSEWAKGHKEVVTAVVAVTIALGALGLACMILVPLLSAVVAMFALIGAPVILITAGIILLGVAFVLAYKNIKPFHDLVNLVGSTLSTVFTLAVNHAQEAISLLILPLTALPALFLLAYDHIKPFREIVDAVAGASLPLLHAALKDLGDVVGWAGTEFGKFAGLLSQLSWQGVIDGITRLWDNIKSIFTGGITDVKTALGGWASGIGSWAANLATSFTGWAGSMVGNFASGLGGGAHNVLVGIGSMFSSAQAWLLALPGVMLTAAVNAVTSFAQSLANGYTAILNALGTWLTNIATWALNLIVKFSTWAGNAIKGFVSALAGGAGTVLGGIQTMFSGAWTWLTNLPALMLQQGKDAATGFLSGIKSIGGSISDYVTSHFDPRNWFGGSSSSNNKNKSGGGWLDFGGGSPMSGGYTSGGQYGNYGSPSANYASSGDVAMFNSLGVGTSGGVMDTDFPAPGGTPFRLPPGGAYKLVTQGQDGNIGGYEVWRNQKTGGTLMFLHAQQLSGAAPGQTVAGGTYVGTSGAAHTTKYGNNPSFYHLCVVTDSGERVWLSDAQMKAAAGKSGGGGIIKIPGVVSATGTTGAYASMMGAESSLPAGFGKMLDTANKAYLTQLKAVNTTFVTDQNKEQTAYLTELGAVNLKYDQARQGMIDKSNLQANYFLEKHGIILNAANQTALVNAQAAASRESTAIQKAQDAGVKKIQKLQDSEASRIQVLQDREAHLTGKNLAKRKAIIDHEIAQLQKTSTTNIATARTDAAANVKAIQKAYAGHVEELAKKLGIHTAEQKAMLKAWLQNHKDVLGENLTKLKNAYDAHIRHINNAHRLHEHNLKTIFDTHIAGIKAAMKAASTPDAMWKSLGTAISTQLATATNNLSFANLTQGPVGADTHGGGPAFQALVNAVVLATNQTEIMTLAQTRGAIAVDLATGNLSGLGSAFTVVGDALKSQLFASIIAGKGIISSYIAGLAKIADANEVIAESTAGLGLVIDGARSDLAAMSGELGTLTGIYLRQWESAVASGTTDLKPFSDNLIKAAKATADVTHANSLNSAYIGQMTGDWAKMKSGYDALFAEQIAAFTGIDALLGRGGTADAVSMLTDKSLAAADSLTSFSEIMSGVGSVVSAITNTAMTEMVRNGSISGGTLGAYGTASAQQSGLTADQIKTNLQLSRSNHDLVAYYKDMGTEVTYLTDKLVNIGAEYGKQSSQYVAAAAQLKQVNNEYEGLGLIIKANGDVTQVDTAHQAEATAALIAFNGSGLDPAIAALGTYTLTLAAGTVTLEQTRTATQLANQDVTDLGNSALNTASTLGSLGSDISNLASTIVNAIAIIDAGLTPMATSGALGNPNQWKNLPGAPGGIDSVSGGGPHNRRRGGSSDARRSSSDSRTENAIMSTSAYNIPGPSTSGYGLNPDGSLQTAGGQTQNAGLAGFSNYYLNPMPGQYSPSLSYPSSLPSASSGSGAGATGVAEDPTLLANQTAFYNNFMSSRAQVSIGQKFGQGKFTGATGYSPGGGMGFYPYGGENINGVYLPYDAYGRLMVSSSITNPQTSMAYPEAVQPVTASQYVQSLVQNQQNVIGSMAGSYNDLGVVYSNGQVSMGTPPSLAPDGTGVTYDSATRMYSTAPGQEFLLTVAERNWNSYVMAGGLNSPVGSTFIAPGLMQPNPGYLATYGAPNLTGIGAGAYGGYNLTSMGQGYNLAGGGGNRNFPLGLAQGLGGGGSQVVHLLTQIAANTTKSNANELAMLTDIAGWVRDLYAADLGNASRHNIGDSSFLTYLNGLTSAGSTMLVTG